MSVCFEWVKCVDLYSCLTVLMKFAAFFISFSVQAQVRKTLETASKHILVELMSIWHFAVLLVRISMSWMWCVCVCVCCNIHCGSWRAQPAFCMIRNARINPSDGFRQHKDKGLFVYCDCSWEPRGAAFKLDFTDPCVLVTYMPKNANFNTAHSLPQDSLTQTSGR